MWFVGLGVLLVALKWAGLGPFASLAWWWVLAPFGLAVAWWGFSDSTGLTQRRAMERHDRHSKKRREERAQALGLRGRGQAGSGKDSQPPAP